MRLALGPALLVAAVALVACGGDRSTPPEPSGAATTSPPLVAIDPATTGKVSGKIVYSGPDPAPFKVDLSADPACAKEQASAVYTPEIVVGPDHALANVVVWIAEGAPAGRYPLPGRTAVLVQRGCSYTPRVQALLIGQPLEIRNDDQTMHNVHVLAHDNREWNRSQVMGGVPILEKFPHEEIPVTFKCNVHPWMKAQVAVLSNPFFAVTAQDGRFEIAGLPAGQYTITAWHETLGTVVRKVAIVAKEASTVDFTLPPGGG